MKRRRSFYKGTPYWEKEKPKVAMSERLILSYYPQAGKLQISQRWDRDGEPQKGKTITLDSEDLQLAPEALTLLIGVLSDWRG